MEKSAASRLSNLKELIQLLNISVQIQVETAALLDEYNQRLYSLEEDRKRLLANYKSLDSKCISLEKRYSELLYKFSELRSR